jgi:hypothetical protein
MDRTLPASLSHLPPLDRTLPRLSYLPHDCSSSLSAISIVSAGARAGQRRLPSMASKSLSSSQHLFASQPPTPSLSHTLSLSFQGASSSSSSSPDLTHVTQSLVSLSHLLVGSRISHLMVRDSSSLCFASQGRACLVLIVKATGVSPSRRLSSQAPVACRFRSSLEWMPSEASCGERRKGCPVLSCPVAIAGQPLEVSE